MNIRCGWAIHSTKRQGHFIRERGFRLWTVGIVVTGSNLIKLKGKPFNLQGPSCILIEPDTPYEVYPSQQENPPMTEEGWAFFQPATTLSRYLHWPNLSKGFMTLNLSDEESTPTIVSVFRELYHCSRRDNPLRWELCGNLLERFFMLCHLCNHDAEPIKQDPRIQDAIGCLEEYFDQPLGVEDIAEQVHMSVSHLAHLFSSQVGMSPIMYRDKIRIERSMSLLLSTNKSIMEIAASVGYENPCHFATRFRKIAGVTPSAYRVTGKSL